MNPNKSDIISNGKLPKLKEIEGIPIRKKAKYLGVTYDKELNIKKSLEAIKPKERYVFMSLYRLLKSSNFRTRYNLWIIFMKPLYRLTYSIIG